MSANGVKPGGNQLFLKKSVAQIQKEAAKSELKRSLGPINLMSLGIGAIIGAGIFVLTGQVAAANAGPAIMLSFVVAGIACGLAGLCYAELASTMPVSGSAYTYAYGTLGEVFAWIMGWLLVLEYGVAASTVAAGWSGNVVSLLANFGMSIPPEFTTSFIKAVQSDAGLTFISSGGANILGAAGILAVTALLVVGISESASVNNVIVFIKVGVLVLFVGVGAMFIFNNQAQSIDNWTPFLPENEGGFKYGLPGIFRAASVIFFAYVGFEAVSTAAAEAKNPQKDIPFGILGSLIACTILYMLIALVLTGVVDYRQLGVAAPIALAVDVMGTDWFSILIKVGAVAGLSSVMLILTYGQTRVFYAMARDGLLPPFFAKLHDKFRTPWIGTIVLGCIIATAAAFLPIEILGDLVSLGTATAFGIVCLSVMCLRTTNKDMVRPFRIPGGGGLVPQWVMVVVAALVVGGMLGFFKFLLNSTWVGTGAIVAGVVLLAWLAYAATRKTKVWVGPVPVLGIFFALVMTGPLIEDIFLKAASGDPIPAILLGSYAAIGALIYIGYGYRNSRLGKGLGQIDDDGPGPGAMQAELHGIGDSNKPD